MQTLGLAESTPRTESRWRALFWPTIRNDGDFDYITRQGFWVCFIVAVITFIISAFAISLAGAFEAVFFFLAALGIRQRSRIAAVAAFSAYLLGAVVLQRYTGAGFSILRIIFLALLFANIRGSWISARWERETHPAIAPIRLNETIADKIVDQLPAILWPKMRFVFYGLAGLEIALLLLSISEPWISIVAN
jgi:hypothetical protein